jgi:serine/threonine-protein kinase
MGLLQEGQMIRETYEVERPLGEGAFAEVYRVRHRFLGRQAMKIFKAPGMTVREIEEVLEEAVILSRIGHPNIIRVFDANTIETSKGIYGYFTMEYVPGGTLEKFWQSYQERFMPIETVVEIMRQTCRGLAVAHSEQPPIIHRDIKPQNILIGYDGEGPRVRVSDFGLAKRVNPMTLLASAKGTMCFKAPEAFRMPRCDSRASDVWALGATLYLLLTDRLPHSGDAEADTLSEKCFERPVIPPSRLNFQVDGPLDRIVLRALAADPSERYPGAGELLLDLEKWKPGVPAATTQSKSKSAPRTSKEAMGAKPTMSKEKAHQMAEKAIQLAREARKLMEAADLMEEALNTCPELRPLYEYSLRLWRRGVVM